MNRMLELFSGSAVMSNTFKERGWKTLSVDRYVDCDYQKDIMQLTRAEIVRELGGEPDFIWASPPCTTFSVASIGTHWGGGIQQYQPKTAAAYEGMALVKKTLEIIGWFFCVEWAIENPRGVLRKLNLIPYTPNTITYCAYGERRMKPTDIWTNLGWQPRPMCKNGAPCHDRAPRGAKTGTQGLDGAHLRGVLPQELCNDIFAATRILKGETHV